MEVPTIAVKIISSVVYIPEARTEMDTHVMMALFETIVLSNVV